MNDNTAKIYDKLRELAEEIEYDIYNEISDEICIELTYGGIWYSNTSDGNVIFLPQCDGSNYEFTDRDGNRNTLHFLLNLDEFFEYQASNLDDLQKQRFIKKLKGK